MALRTQAFPELVLQSPSKLTVRGDLFGGSVCYAFEVQSEVNVSATLSSGLDGACGRGLPLSVNPLAVTQMLCCGLVPMPKSIFSGIFALGIGDVLHSTRSDAGSLFTHAVDFPYVAAKSRQDQVPDAKRLMLLLTASLEQKLAEIDSAVLMLSSGKDSVAIAAALARLGRKDVRCLTFVANTEKDEDGYARALCSKLGLPHERIEMPGRRPVDGDVLTDFFRNAPSPCADDCQIPYVFAVHAAGNVGAVLDGSGNDVYMGHVPSRNDRWRDRLRMRSRALAKGVEHLVPYGTKWDQLLRDPVEHCFVQGFFRQREIEAIFPAAVFDDAWKEPLLEAYRGLDVFDFRALVRGRHYDQGSCALKAFMACEAAGMRCLLPWCDADIIDYYFNLPESARFDRRTYTNKVLLREMLHKEIDYPDTELGKRYFQFDRIGFYEANKARVYEEILECAYWDRVASEKLLADIYRRLPRNARVGVSLNAWFLLSGWLNHNRWLHAGPAGDVAT